VRLDEIVVARCATRNRIRTANLEAAHADQAARVKERATERKKKEEKEKGRAGGGGGEEEEKGHAAQEEEEEGGEREGREEKRKEGEGKGTGEGKRPRGRRGGREEYGDVKGAYEGSSGNITSVRPVLSPFARRTGH